MARSTVLVLIWQRSATSVGVRRRSVMSFKPPREASGPTGSALEAGVPRALAIAEVDRHPLRRGPLDREFEHLGGITLTLGGRELGPFAERRRRAVQPVLDPPAA